MTGEQTAVTRTALAAGDVLADRYELVRSLTEDERTRVFEGRDRQSGERVRVALVSRRADALALARYSADVVRARGLAHPGAIRPREVGMTPLGQLFVISDLAEGVPLDVRLEQGGRMGSAQTARLLGLVLEVLAEAHAAGVIHRELKPANLILSDEGRPTEQVRLTGLGTGLAVSGDFAAINVSTGMRLGAPAYMAPELLSGNPATPAADVYSAGLILVEMLTGRPVINAPTVAQAISAQMSLDVDAVVARLGEVPLAEVAQRALSRTTADRYPDAGAMLQAVRATAVGPELDDESATPQVFDAEVSGAGLGLELATASELDPSVREDVAEAALVAAVTPTGQAAVRPAGELSAELLASLSVSRETIAAEERRGRRGLFGLLFVFALAGAAALYLWKGTGDGEDQSTIEQPEAEYELVVVDGDAATREGTSSSPDERPPPLEAPAPPAHETVLPAGEGSGAPSEPTSPSATEGASVEGPVPNDVTTPAEVEVPAEVAEAEPPVAVEANPPAETAPPAERVRTHHRPEAETPAEVVEVAEAAPPAEVAEAETPARTETPAEIETPAEMAALDPETPQHYVLQVRITTEPSRARLRVGTRDLDRTPFEGILESDTPTVVVSLGKRGHQRGHVTIDMTTGTGEYHVVLEPLSDYEGGSSEEEDDGNPFGTINRRGGD